MHDAVVFQENSGNCACSIISALSMLAKKENPESSCSGIFLSWYLLEISIHKLNYMTILEADSVEETETSSSMLMELVECLQASQDSWLLSPMILSDVDI